tara:strand:- start:2132 stop:2866 length:735 start_codon:yes stop_codon:yes gene_type:complete
MITSYIQGGLGNQLFQIAAGAALANRLGVEFALHEGQHFLPYQGNNISFYRDNILKNIKFKDLSSNGFSTHRWDSPKHLQIPKKDNQALVGYFQSEKYFQDWKGGVKDLFCVPKIEMPEGSVSLHIRRGDYLKFPEIHNTLEVDYYRKALSMIQNYSHVYIFTDSDVPFKLDIPNSTIIQEGADVDHLAMMSSCSHNIIANSTFSWWAAYLNENDNQVIAPKQWFGPKGPQGWEDIYCEGWEVI